MMVSQNCEITSGEKRISVSFLEKGDFIEPISLDKNAFGSNLDRIIQINSQKSGLCLNNLDISDSLGIICQLTPFLAAQFYQQSKQNVSLVIKNGLDGTYSFP